LDLKCAEKNIVPYDVITADEAFMTGTPMCLLPVTSLNSVPIGDGEVGEITKLLLDTWSESVGVDIVGQIKAWDETRSAQSTEAPSPYAFGKKR